jgi:hypothetical protein
LLAFFPKYFCFCFLFDLDQRGGETAEAGDQQVGTMRRARGYVACSLGLSATGNFPSEQISHQQPTSSTFLSE